MSTFVLAMVAIITIVTREILISDKESYLFEDIEQSTFLDSLKVRESLQRWQTLARSIFTNAIIQKEKDSVGEIVLPNVFFNDNPHIIDFRIFRRGVKGFTLIDKINNPKLLKKSQIQKALSIDEKDILSFMNEVYQNIVMVRVYKKSQKKNGELELRVGLYDSQKRYGSVFRFNLSKNLDQIKTKRNFQRLLVNENGKILYHNMGNSDGSDLEPIEKESSFFRSLNTLDAKNGVQSLNINGDRYIVGYSKISSLNLMAVTLQSETSAYKVQSKLFLEMLKVAILFVILMLIFIFFVTGKSIRSLDRLNIALSRSLEGDYSKVDDHYIGDEIGKFVKNYNLFIEDIQNRMDKLNNSNANLEREIENKSINLTNVTNFMNAMSENTEQGLFIFSPSGKILPIYTKRTEDFFGANINLKNAKDLLPFENSDSADKIIKDLFESIDNFDDCALKAPREIIVFEPNRLLGQVQYFPMKNAEGFVQFVGVIITDRTEEEILISENNNLKIRFQIVDRILKNKITFFEGFKFFERFRQLLSQALEDIETINIESMKDNLLLDFEEIKKFIKLYCDQSCQEKFQELFDDLILSSRKGKLTENFSLNGHHFLKSSQKMINLFELIVKESLYDKELRFEIKRNVLFNYRENLIEGLKDSNHYLIDSFDREFLKLPIKDYFKGFNETLQTEASKAGKLVAPLEFENGEILVDRIFYRPIFEGFKDLFIFIANESIEERILREELGKRPSAKVKVEFEIVRKKIEIRVIDDGRGVDPNKLREIMQQNNLLEEEIEESEEQIISHFYDLYMKNFKNIIDANGGAAILSTTKGKGSIFKFRLPLQ